MRVVQYLHTPWGQYAEYNLFITSEEDIKIHLQMAEPFEEQLVENVRNYKHLYDTSMALHSAKHASENSWREIATILATDADTCKKKWKQIRDRYVRARKVKEVRSRGLTACLSLPLYVV